MKHEINPFRSTMIRAALAEWLREDQFSHAITLNLNRGEVGLPTLERFFRDFCMEVDRVKNDCSRVYRLPTCERVNAVAMPERLNSNTHLHIAADLRFASAQGRTDGELADVIRLIWDRLTKGSGAVDVTRVRDGGWPWYMTKEALRPGHSYLLAADYHPP